MKKDKRHFICSGITVLFALFGILFLNCFPRLLESFRDLLSSIVYYCFQIIDPDNNPIPATINYLPEWKIFGDIWKPVRIIPASFEEFLEFWSAYLHFLFSPMNIREYLAAVSDFFFYGSRILLIFFPAVIAFVLLLVLKSKKVCTDRNKKSPMLTKFQAFLYRWIYPVVAWIRGFFQFLKDNPGYHKSWIALWLLYFNVYSIVLSLIGYYFYFVSSFDLLSIYTQLLKLQHDLTPVIRFIPAIGWFLIFAKIYNIICCEVAFDYLYAGERANRAIISKASIITSVYGEPGLGKTKSITSMALTAQVKQFDDAFQIMLNRAAQFPNFPWQVFRDYIDDLIERRVICDINQAKKWIASRRWKYEYATRVLTPELWKRMLRKHPELITFTFGYDYLHYPSTYNNELTVVHLFEALESYAAAYLVFSVETNLLFSNYSIRSDSLIKDLGNLILRDNDFFDRDPELQAVYSQHSHIFDFDILRPGKKIIEGNKNANGAPVGVIVITEIDKEFKNMNVLKEIKANANETNQKNDLHDAALMMIRHGVVIDNKAFVTVLADLQRPEAWGAGGRELGNVVFIEDKTPMVPVLPFFSTYWLTQGVFSFVWKKWNNFHANYQYRRADETLPIYLINNLMSAIYKHYDRLQNMFGMEILYFQIQSGRMDGAIRKEKLRIFSKKDFADRFTTDCLSSVWDKYTPNTMYIDDFITYAGKLATKEECAQQNSYFQNDIHKMKENYK